MPPLQENPNCEKAFATFRLQGISLVPAEVTSALRLGPAGSVTKSAVPTGDEALPAGPHQSVGIWSLESQGDVASTNLERHLTHLLDVLDPVAEPLLRLRRERQWACDFFCFWMSRSGHGGPDLSPAVLARITALGATLSIDFYGPGPKRPATTPPA